MPALPTPPDARAVLANLLQDPAHPTHPLIWLPNPPPHLPGNLDQRRQRHAQDIQSYRHQLRDLSQSAGIPMIWVTEDVWGNTTTEPL